METQFKTAYYPFGLTIDALSWERDDAVPNRYLYNSFELQDEISLGWYDYLTRQYDPALGRFNAVDPLADKFASVNPYNFGFNDPVYWNDPLGDEPGDDDNPFGWVPYDDGFGYGRNNSGRVFANDFLRGGWQGSYARSSGYGTQATNQRLNARAVQNRTNYADRQAQRLAADLGGITPGITYRYVKAKTFDPNDNLYVVGDVTSTDFLPRGADPWLGYLVIRQENNVFGFGTNEGGAFALSLNVTPGGGFNFDFGVVWDDTEDWGLFYAGGPSVGIDASIGVSYRAITPNSGQRFRVQDYQGYGGTDNVAFYYFDWILDGGDNLEDNISTRYGRSYHETGGGLSIGVPFGYTREFTATKLLSWFK